MAISPLAGPVAPQPVAPTKTLLLDQPMAPPATAPADGYERAHRTPVGGMDDAARLPGESVKVGNPATFDPKTLSAKLVEPRNPREKNLAIATRTLALAPNDVEVQAHAVDAAAELLVGRPATTEELSLAASAFAQGRTMADVMAYYAALLTPQFEPTTVSGGATPIRNHAAPEPGKVGPTSLTDSVDQPVDLGRAQGLEKYQKFFDETRANPLADVLRAYLDAVKDNRYSVNGVTDGVNFKTSGPGVDRFLSPSGELDFRNIAQGKQGDCYFLAGVAGALAPDPSRIQSVIQPTTDASGRAGYNISLYKPTSLQVTDTEGNLINDFSTSRVNSVSVFNGSRQTVFVSQDEINQWHSNQHLGEADKTSSALELGAIKIAGPQVMNGGDPVSGFYMLTGRNSVTFGDTNQVLANNPLIGGMSNDQLFVAGEQLLRSGGVLTFGLEKTTLNQYGFDPAYNMHDHQFTVLDVSPTGVILRNPWGGVETGSTLGKPGTQGDGIMTLPWDQVKGAFNTISVSSVAPPETRIPQTMTFPEAQQTVRAGYEDIYRAAWQRDFSAAPMSLDHMKTFVDAQMAHVTGDNIAAQVYQVTALKDEQVAGLTWKK